MGRGASQLLLVALVAGCVEGCGGTTVELGYSQLEPPGLGPYRGTPPVRLTKVEIHPRFYGRGCIDLHVNEDGELDLTLEQDGESDVVRAAPAVVEGGVRAALAFTMLPADLFRYLAGLPPRTVEPASSQHGCAGIYEED